MSGELISINHLPSASYFDKIEKQSGFSGKPKDKSTLCELSCELESI